MSRRGFTSDVSNEEWAFVAPYLTRMREDAPQREHNLREVFNGLRYVVKNGISWRDMPGDLPPGWAVYQQMQRWVAAGCFERRKGSKVHMAVDTLGYLLALHVTPANEQERAQVGALAAAVQEATAESVELVYVDQGYTGQDAEDAAAEHGIALEVIKHTEAKKGFVLLPRRWVVEHSFAWMSRFRRLARNYERLPKTFAALHYVAFAALMLSRYADVLQSP